MILYISKKEVIYFMKLLVSDYDGTLKLHLNLNIPALKKFMEKGNTFMISTGRNYESIKSEIDRYQIPFDYVSCNDGAVLLDKEGKIIYSKLMNEDDVDILTLLLRTNPNVKKVLWYDQTRVTDKTDNIVELCVFLKLFARAKKELEDLQREYPHIKFYQMANYIYIKKHFNKSEGLKLFLSMNDNSYDQVVTVGDGSNDIEMLQDFDGYKMIISHPQLLGKGIKTTNSVYSLIKKMTK